MSNQFFQRRIYGIRIGELLTFQGLYVFMAAFYHITLWVNRMGFENAEDGLFDPITFFEDSGLDYILKLILTIPIWFLLFRKLKQWKWSKRLALHIILLPLFVIVWQQLYYISTEALGFGHLRGTGKVWDIYIPAMFYILQFGIIHSYAYYRENQSKILLEGELRNAALKSELSAIKAQLNPHFLYNIFNTINASLPPENERTRNMIAELSDLFRYQLRATKEELVPLRDELEFVKKYLNLEKERFQDRLSFAIQVSDDILDEQIPPMLLQPLVENSVKHGITPLIEGGTIEIKIDKKGDKLVFEISDTGIGVENKEALLSKGIGLNNTQMRLEKMYQSALQLTDNLPRGLKINFAI